MAVVCGIPKWINTSDATGPVWTGARLGYNTDKVGARLSAERELAVKPELLGLQYRMTRLVIEFDTQMGIIACAAHGSTNS